MFIGTLEKQHFGWSLASGCPWSCGYSSSAGLHLPGQHLLGGTGKVFMQNFQICTKQIFLSAAHPCVSSDRHGGLGSGKGVVGQHLPPPDMDNPPELPRHAALLQGHITCRLLRAQQALGPWELFFPQLWSTSTGMCCLLTE